METRVISKNRKNNNNRQKKINHLEQSIRRTFNIVEGLFTLGPRAVEELNTQMNKLHKLESQYTNLTGRPLICK